MAGLVRPIIAHSTMHQRTVVPQDEIVRAPVIAIEELRLDHVAVQIGRDRVALIYVR